MRPRYEAGWWAVKGHAVAHHVLVVAGGSAFMQCEAEHPVGDLRPRVDEDDRCSSCWLAVNVTGAAS